MKKYTIAIPILFLTLCFAAFSSDYDFKVLAISGNVKVLNNGNWKDLKFNNSIFQTDKVKIEKNAYLGLVHSSGKTLEIKKEGEYSVKDLASGISNKGANLTKKLTNYVINQISDADDMMANKDYRQSMSITGSVERSLEMSDPNAEKPIFIQVHFPRKTRVLNNNILLKWDPVESIKSYNITIHDRFDREITKIETQDNIATIDLDEIELEKGVYYFISLNSADNLTAISDTFAFSVTDELETEKIMQEEKEIRQNIDESALSKILLASFYEQKGLYIEAEKYYQDAVNTSPDVDSFNKMFSMFRFKYSSGN